MLYTIFTMVTRVTLDLILLIIPQPEITTRSMVALCAIGNQIALALTFGDAAQWPGAGTSCCLIMDCPILTTPDLTLLRAHHLGMQKAPLLGNTTTLPLVMLRRVVKEHTDATTFLVVSPTACRQRVTLLISPKEHS
ncbi:MAG: hypothetical protein AB7P69_03125 [Candidatus Binatia bacterium]